MTDKDRERQSKKELEMREDGIDNMPVIKRKKEGEREREGGMEEIERRGMEIERRDEKVIESMKWK